MKGIEKTLGKFSVLTVAELRIEALPFYSLILNISNQF